MRPADSLLRSRAQGSSHSTAYGNLKLLYDSEPRRPLRWPDFQHKYVILARIDCVMHVATDHKNGVSQEMGDQGPREDFTADRYLVQRD